jgi:hypothetical protein
MAIRRIRIRIKVMRIHNTARNTFIHIVFMFRM